MKPGGKAIITTPNIVKTLTRNPWHEREYKAQELIDLCTAIFDNVEAKGIAGNEKVMEYYEQNIKSVRKITRFDFLNLQYNLPNWALRIPYDLLNRLNRNTLQKGNTGLVSEIDHEDYLLTDKPEEALDLFYVLTK